MAGNDVAFSLSWTLVPLCVGIAINSIAYLWITRKQPDTVHDIFAKAFAWLASAVVIARVLNIIEQSDMIYRSQQIKLGIIPAAMYIAAFTLAYFGLRIKHGFYWISGSFALGFFVYLYRTMT